MVPAFDCVTVAARYGESLNYYLFDRADDPRVALLVKQGGVKRDVQWTRRAIQKEQLVDRLIVPDAMTRDRLKRFFAEAA